MKETGILFKDRLVRAILRDGNPKTQTRRLAQVPPFFDPEEEWPKCPYGGPGDRLWVREAWSQFYRRTETNSGICWRADYTTERAAMLGPWKPGIHLFRKDARTVLDITTVRVERIQDITEADAQAEGVEPSGNGWLGPELRVRPRTPGLTGWTETKLYPTAREAFRHLWGSINAKRPGGSWDANPFVWAITFQRVTP